MADKLLKIIKAVVIPLSLIGLILLIIFLNKLLLDYSNSRGSYVSEQKIVTTETTKNIKGSLVSTINKVEKNEIPQTNISPKTLNNNDRNANQNEIYKVFNLNNAPASSKLGTNIHWAFREEPNHDILINEIIDEGNIKFAREEFNWELIEPEKGKRDYSRYDEVMHNYKHYNIEVLGLLAYSTNWSAKTPDQIDKNEFYPPNISEWSDFVAETVTRYKGQVKVWEIWNEPNDSNFFKGSQAEYNYLLKNSYNTIKSIDPNAVVISGGTTWPDPVYAKNFYNSGMANYIDGYGVHAYYCDQGIKDNHYEKLATDLVPIINLSKQHQKKIWITEFGCSSFEIGQKKQADNLAYMLSLFNSSVDIERVYWYSLRDTMHPGKEGNFGLISEDFTLKQSFQAFKYFNP